MGALNIYRWIHHHSFPRCIVVNIASATLCYYEQDSLRLRMKVVVGKPSTRTPRFAAWCDQVVLYPYWNIPRKIAVNEFMPMFRRVPALANAMNIQLLDSRGRVVDPASIDWPRWNKRNFPYSMRQSTGCDNALGVIKFNLTSPYDVYMHDTNLKQAFHSTYRYYSHGCIRLEKPFELGAALLGDKLDTSFLALGLKDQQPLSVRLQMPVPVFVVYLTADIDAEGKLRFFKDIYHLLD
jgi:murein L,D-transpeptidase YcbB/YkuD